MKKTVCVAFLAMLLGACAAEPGTTDEADVVLDDEGKADTATETRVRTGETSLWVRNAIERELRADGRDVFVVRGRTSRDLTDGSAFVFDDVKGDWAKLSTRTFEVTYAADDLGFLEGQDHFVRNHFKPSADRPENLTARIAARTRLTGFTGSGMWLSSDVAPVVYAGQVVFRVSGNASSKLYGLRARVGDLYLAPRQLDDTHFEIDLSRDDVLALAGTTASLQVEVDLIGGTRTKSAKLVLRLARLGMTSEDPYEVWPPLGCEDEVRACLDGLPAGTLDTADCGEALEVQQCQGQVGVFFDDVAFAAAMDDAQATLADPAGFAGDADALIGADRVVQFAAMVEQTVEGRLEQLFGRWYPDAASRDAAAAAEIAAAIDLAYARPLDVWGDGPHFADPTDLATMRQVVADALLLHLGSLDLTATEFGRPLEELCRTYRARHVADLRAWRTTVERVDGGDDRDVYVGNWLDPYVEVTTVRTTGAVLNVLFEID
jgi:hypothetical protein